MSLDVDLYVEVDTGGPKPHKLFLFEYNITHNLGKMARAANIYKALWRPEEIGIKYASELIPILTKGLNELRSNPTKYKAYDAPNKWGVYKDLVEFVHAYLEACKEHPKAKIQVSR